MTAHADPDLSRPLRLTHPNTVQRAARTADRGVSPSEARCPRGRVLGRTASPYELGEDTLRPVAVGLLL